MSFTLSPGHCIRLLACAGILVVCGAAGVELLLHGGAGDDLGGLYSLFSLTYQQSLPAWHGAALCLGLAGLCQLYGQCLARDGLERRGWQVLVLLCLLLSLDRATGFSEPLFYWLRARTIGIFSPGTTDEAVAAQLLVFAAAMAGLLALLLSLATLAALFLKRLPRRLIGALVAAGLASWAGCWIGGQHVLTRLWYRFGGSEQSQDLMVALQDVLVLALDVAALSYLCVALCRELHARLGRLSLDMGGEGRKALAA